LGKRFGARSGQFLRENGKPLKLFSVKKRLTNPKPRKREQRGSKIIKRGKALPGKKLKKIEGSYPKGWGLPLSFHKKLLGP